MFRAEAALERRILKACKSLGILCIKFKDPGRRGAPDRLLLAPNGRAGFLELKAPGKKPRREQQAYLALLEAQGFATMVTDDFLEAITWIGWLCGDGKPVEPFSTVGRW